MGIFCSDSSGEILSIDHRQLVNGEYTIEGLDPDSDYTITVEPLFVGNGRHVTYTALSVRTANCSLTAGTITGISVAGTIGLLLIVVGLFTVIRWHLAVHLFLK